ncbi:DNA cytosine methyltransferase [Micrococcus luteus]|uniref:DNA cytosine methyltransferase n=1 Tax=Micrococcus luteus TaxID=1270 RepID=UPI001D0C610D|nr:DNA (cytosine-5-)-methyltransferase [Micrococcus luteus]MCC0766391.1 DNA (cytosine-5-)-methyltransferase [Micrococcus luteus]MCV7607207.1 DNA (cytosine-5-)-methyltransferase [Micrococcus luteus]
MDPDATSAQPAHYPTVAEFFAGIGLARVGMERAGLRVTWANELESFKHQMYAGNFGADPTDSEFVLGDVAHVRGDDLPHVDVAWSSFPCTDLSLAGGRAGLSGKHSSTFYEFTRVLEEMGDRKPAVVALENVTALASSHGGDDLAAAIRELNRLGYSADVLAIDARRFVPQSRPRLFIIAALTPPPSASIPNPELRPTWLDWVFEDPTLATHQAELPPLPLPLTEGFSSTVEDIDEDDPRWWDKNRTSKFMDSLSPIQNKRVSVLMKQHAVSYRTAYRRTRGGVPVWEVRADDISGCLRTARGGSSKQAVVKAGNGNVKVRWMTPLEYARLMGAGDYQLSGLRDSQILFGFGDAVCVDAVQWVAEHYLVPLIPTRSNNSNEEDPTEE